MIFPAAQFSGMIKAPVTSSEDTGAMIGRLYPTTHFLTISRGTFSKALGFSDVSGAYLPLLFCFPVLMTLACLFLGKQEK